ncbi:hypothetical protein [Rubrivirga litoralis]|uniref:Uncharacterized protein n=1 Tax=Rubrivirga litoralis TaxID=3075598 RepID=A0ABU3BPP8_9BACT|nr:hypothetical protein [Rubrivirga sp. F394]MDT0631264.1 hypothetical protein [Rubrivirga sp. F394]
MSRRAPDAAPLVGDVRPRFAAELGRLLAASGLPELAAQVRGLRLVGRCRCGQTDCATFHVVTARSAPPNPAYRRLESDSLDLEARGGVVVVDVEGGRLQTVEVLGWPRVKEELDAVLPASRGRLPT